MQKRKVDYAWIFNLQGEGKNFHVYVKIGNDVIPTESNFVQRYFSRNENDIKIMLEILN